MRVHTGSHPERTSHSSKQLLTEFRLSFQAEARTNRARFRRGRDFGETQAGVEEAITAIGATLLYLPPYSPDLNPIEKFFSKLKALLRKAAQRDIDALWKEIGELLNTVSPSECTNYFASCGYVST